MIYAELKCAFTSMFHHTVEYLADFLNINLKYEKLCSRLS